MTGPLRLKQEAKLIPIEERKRIIAAIPETELHYLLEALFRAMNPSFWVEVTHGTTEFGKDLVIVRTDPVLPDVTGVVVKRGDIRGKTAGEVDGLRDRVDEVLTAKGEKATEEILSQIRQATSYDAALSSHVRELKVNNVLVIVAGALSGNARRRIEGEVGSVSVIRDLPWLVESFSEYYPQVFFEARAVDYLYEVIDRMDVDSFHAKSGKTLTECYVDPVLARMDSELSYDDATSVVHMRNRRTRFGQLASDLAPTKRVLLVGDPGSGKSKVVAKYCIDNYRKALNHMTRRERAVEAVPIPIMTSARQLAAAGGAQQLLDSLLPQVLRDRLVPTTLVVDGLDEVPGDERENVLRIAEEYALELGTALIVTSRRLAALSAAPPGFARYEILPFEFGQAMKLVNKVLVNKDVLPALKEGIKSIQSQLPMNPLSLILLIEVVAERKEVPASITELYERFLDLVFGRWDRDKGIDVLFEYVVKKRFLATLAYTEFYQKQRLEIPAEAFESFLNDYAIKYGWDNEKLRAFVKEIDRAGVLDTHEDVFFRHRSFLDFFVGHYVHEQRADFDDLTESISTLYHDALWTEAAFFFTGLGREVSEAVIEAIFAFDDKSPDLPLQKLFAGRLLQAGWHSPTAVKARGLRLALEQIPAASQRTRDFFGGLRRSVPSFLADLATLAIAGQSLSSFAIAVEAGVLLTELERVRDLSPVSLQKRAALLWALQAHSDPGTHGDSLKRFVTDVVDANLGAVEEAKFLVIAGLSDPTVDVRKMIGRRIRRLEKDTPNAISALIPSKKTQFRPPPKK